MRISFKYEYRRGTKVTKTAHNANAMFGNGTGNDPTILGLTAFVVETLT